MRLALIFAACSIAAAARPPAAITIDYPAEGAIFPPDIAPPTFLWHDAEAGAAAWRIEITFGDRSRAIVVDAPGAPPQVGEIDERCAKAGAVPPELPPQEKTAHAWKPDPQTWAAIKQHSVKRRAVVKITGLRDAAPVSQGQVLIQTSKDPVGAPIFYRDVPLIPFPSGQKGVIMPLPTEAVPLIAWRLKSVSEPGSRLMMEGLPTCVNCHSFSRDGKILGLDVDGPNNDKGLYGLVQVATHTSIRRQDVIRWSAFSEERAAKRFGFMSQVSPDGEHIVTSIEDPSAHRQGLDNRLFNGFYNDYGFGQVFYPTRGILAWYSKKTGKLQRLPGADDRRYVQAAAFWSPDGKYIVFSRAEARDPYHEGQALPLHANDPEETQIQYDLYRIPFNGGRGGRAEPIEGASGDGFSNNFPKVSPDGRWIVYVRNKTGLLMRPDSKLWIVPFKGGVARPLRSNTTLMNSWHSFSPNGRWLVFSSKGRSLYTQLYLTHIDKDGTDSPAILIENATAANRAVNIPEFVNIAPDAIYQMDAPATEFYRLMDLASSLAQKGEYAAAVPEWRKAVELEPEDAKARYNLGVALQRQGAVAEAMEQYDKALKLDPQNAAALTNVAVALAAAGRFDEAIARYEQALAINPNDAKAHNNLGVALLEKGRTDEALGHFEKAVELDPEYAEACNSLGVALARRGKLDEGIGHLEQAVQKAPESLEYRYNLGRVLAARGRFGDAIPHFEKAVSLSGGKEPMSLDMLAAMYGEVGRFADAAQTARRALELTERANNPAQAQSLRARIRFYEAQASAAK